MSRRLVCARVPAVAVTLAVHPVIAQNFRAAEAYAADGATTRKKLDGGGSVAVPSTWQQRDDGALADPVLGTVTSSLASHRLPMAESVASIEALGRVDAFDLATLGLRPPRDRGDIVAARRRTDAADVVYYDWDLAVSPDECPREQRLVVTTCLPDEVALVSACVKDGALVVLECAVKPAEWKNFAGALRTMRSSFVV